MTAWGTGWWAWAVGTGSGEGTEQPGVHGTSKDTHHWDTNHDPGTRPRARLWVASRRGDGGCLPRGF